MTCFPPVVIIDYVFLHRMGSALLSRFDLVFILLDKPDEVNIALILWNFFYLL